MDRQIETHLNRIEGQIKGVRKMLSDQRPCNQIVQQIVAIRSSLTSLGKKVLRSEASSCIQHKDDIQLSSIIDQLFKVT
jgi:DNA-binding FrmR family transcriptional regulator